MSFWAGLAKPKGLGKKVIRVIEPLTFGTHAARNNFSSNTYPGGVAGDQAGLVCVIPELVKVDFAIVQTMSCAALGSGFAYPTVTNYSANAFGINFASSTSGLAPMMFSPTSVSGMNVSGVLELHALVIGEMRQEVP